MCIVKMYVDEEGNSIHEIDAEQADLEKGFVEDNMLLGTYHHIKLYTASRDFVNRNRGLTCKDKKIPYNDTWRSLVERFPFNKVLLINGCYYEIIRIAITISTGDVIEGGWLDTCDYIGKIIVRNYGDTNDNGMFSFTFNVKDGWKG